MAFRLVVTSVRCSGRYLIGGSHNAFDGPVPMDAGTEFVTLGNARGYVRRELSGLSVYWRAEVVNADGVTVQVGHRGGVNASGKTFHWSDPVELSADELATAREVYAAQREGREITDACARVIGAMNAAGMGAGQAFASTGAIVTPDDSAELWRELAGTELQRSQRPRWERDALDMLGTYLVRRFNAGEVGPVPGWSALWVR